jgi:hypothetical protein
VHQTPVMITYRITSLLLTQKEIFQSIRTMSKTKANFFLIKIKKNENFDFQPFLAEVRRASDIKRKVVICLQFLVTQFPPISAFNCIAY